ncbi:MAG: nitrogen fixation protein NifZ [Betaproteobacteria bacterium HGW-Betaproteobacteria-11]|jgi:nitrogen fixation protein NifZ|nr:MAG: nitrogen fixation protein NifZ [Betaproteobacteria bacterium HGW-Betaproteobacteria-11]
MRPRWDYGDAVRVTRNVRNDGTFPGVKTGDLLVRRGRIGHVRNVGTFLQDQIIYSVHFLDEGRLVGCREEELIGVDEPWIESRYEVRQKVRATQALAIRGEVQVPAGSRGEVLNLERSTTQGVVYHVHFDCLPGNPLQVPEAALSELESGDE